MFGVAPARRISLVVDETGVICADAHLGDRVRRGNGVRRRHSIWRKNRRAVRDLTELIRTPAVEGAEGSETAAEKLAREYLRITAGRGGLRLVLRLAGRGTPPQCILLVAAPAVRAAEQVHRAGVCATHADVGN